MISKIIQLNENSFSLDSIFGELAFLRSEYPDFYGWFYKKVVPGLKDGSRKIFTIKTPISFGKINGVLILKNTIEEKKICTLYIDRASRLNGLGRKFIDIAFNELDTDKPLITIAENRLSSFSKLLSDYNFELYEKNPDFYSKGMIEYSYNGNLYLPKESIIYA